MCRSFRTLAAVAVVSAIFGGSPASADVFAPPADPPPFGDETEVAPLHPDSPSSADLTQMAMSGLGVRSGVPEPACWALMIIGVGGTGAILRWKRRVARQV